MFQRGLVSFVLGIFLFGFPAASSADPVVITFDELALGFHPSFEYTSLGVVFNSGAGSAGTGGFNVVASSSAVSPPNIMRPRDPSTQVWTDLNATFFVPFPSVPNNSPFATTDFLSVSIVGANPDSPWEFRLVSPRGFLTSITGTSNQTLTFFRPNADIRGFEFQGTGTEGLDNVSFNTPAAVPEPGTLLLAGSGIVGLYRCRKRDRASVLQRRATLR